MPKTPPPIVLDADYYLKSNPDISDGVDAADHYRHFGWREDRDPSPHFDTHFYKSRYADFGVHDLSPLDHYNSIGRLEHRLTLPVNTRLLHALQAGPPSSRVAFHCRITDLSLWPEICDLLATTNSEHPIVLSTHHQVQYDGALRYAEKYDGLYRRFLSIIVPQDMLDLDVLLSPLLTERSRFDVWANMYTAGEISPASRSYQLSQTLGSSEQMAKYTGRLTGENPSGLCFCEPFRAARNEVRRGWIEGQNLDADYEYPSESFLWVRSDVLEQAADRQRAPEAEDAKPGNRRSLRIKAICDAATSKNYGFHSIRTEILRPDLMERPAASAAENADQRGTRWRSFSPAITGNRPLALSTHHGPVNSRRIDLHWVIPDYSEGGGGHMTIFRFVHLLEKSNFRQTIWIQNGFNHASPAQAKQRIQSWYQPISDDVIVRFLPDDVEAITGDAIIATDCWSAFPVSRMTRFKERFYFIQDWESEFHPAGDLRLAASLTYQFAFSALTAGTWLAKKAAEAGMDVVCWTLGADRINYRPKASLQIRDTVFSPAAERDDPDLYKAWRVGKSEKGQAEERGAWFEYRRNGLPFDNEGMDPDIPHIALYARGFTPRRAVDLAIEGLKSLASRGWLFHVHLYGEDKDFGELPFIYTPHGLTDPKTLGRIYAKCDLGVAFSATNYSLVPLEMMVADIPVVEIDTESTRTAYPANAVVRAAPAAYAIADELEALLKDPARRRALIEAGRQFVDASDWSRSAAIVGDEISSRVLSKSTIDIAPVIDAVKTRSTQPVLPAPAGMKKPAASILIPTYNAGRDFDVVLQAIAEQKFDAEFELVVIDSGSADETLAIVDRWSEKIRTHVITIENSEFGHGRTRNQGIDASQGEYVAILTQDACPASPLWLQNLVDGFGAGDRVAGVFGRHIAYPIHEIFEGPALRDFFEGFRLIGPLYSMDDDLPGYVHRGSPNWQSALQFYSDNNSCLRKSVWNAVPYKDVPWGEDQIWAWDVMRLGFQKAYAHDAAVYHSHDYAAKKLMQVGREEGRMFLKHFGMYIGIDGSRRDSTDLLVRMIRDSVAADEKVLEKSVPADEKLLLRRALQHLALFVGRSDGVTDMKRELRE